jgi:hypothetical protein
MTVVRMVYGVVTGLYSIAMLAATFLWKWIPLLQTDQAMGYSFVIVAVLAIPFITTLTRLGLNQPDGGPPVPEITKRQQAFERACPAWKYAWNGTIAFLVTALLLTMLTAGRVHFFFAFSAGVSFLTSVWFLFVYPVAAEMYSRLEPGQLNWPADRENPNSSGNPGE